MKRIALLLVLALVAVACGDDDTAETVPETVVIEDAAPDTVPPEDTTTTAANEDESESATTVPPPISDAPTDCLEIWPEALVQAVAGGSFTFFEANNDRSACTYTAIPDSIALAWRVSDQFGFDQSESGAAITAEVFPAAVCDDGFFTVIQEAVLIMEGYSEAQGRAYTATISGFDIGNAEAQATALIGAAC